MEINELWKQVIALTKKHFPDNTLSPILGHGTLNPKYMIVFINPTARNISSDSKWKGPRFPFIGTKHVWSFFNKINIINSNLLSEIKNNHKNWNLEFTNKVLNELKKNNIWLTNIVKNTGYNAKLPQSKQINLYTPHFLKEIEIVNPEYIIAFGLIPIKALLKKDIKLGNYLDYLRKHKKPKIEKIKINNKIFKVIPCYYPIGRGNPHKALEILNKVMKL